MGFADTYREEVIDIRRARGRTARLIGRLIGLVLTLAFMVALNTEPGLRKALTDAGVRGVSIVLGVQGTSAQGSDAERQTTSTLPRNRLVVNRGTDRAALTAPSGG